MFALHFLYPTPLVTVQILLYLELELGSPEDTRLFTPHKMTVTLHGCYLPQIWASVQSATIND
jgi:hypothetical protein